MLVIGGIVFILAMVFGSYILSGGKIGIIMEALPHEIMGIGGGAVGAMIVGNQGVILKQVMKDFGKAFKGCKWHKKDYIELLTLLFKISKLVRTKGMIAIESHIENPAESELFKAYPRIVHDHFAIELICDTLRLMIMNFTDPFHVETCIQNKLDKHHHEAIAAGGVLQNMSDGLPAIGIVAAVLGVIKTMASINQPTEVLGAMIGSALVGTFMGVFLSYCVVGPIAHKILDVVEEDGHFYLLIRDMFIAHLQGNAPQISVEIARGNVPTHIQPTFIELENAINAVS
jgi:chemotaxis protein MotA